jgi:phosphoribosyl 1,2-cyclic phosphate phosphodiesterase
MLCTLLGTGTSHGIPVIGCDCHVCSSNDPSDKRFRTSAYISGGSSAPQSLNEPRAASVLIDTGPEFRLQAIAHRIAAIDAVLITHSHADHIHGIDDLRIFSNTNPKHAAERKPLPLYSNAHTLKEIESRFSYIFKPTLEGGGKPNISVHGCEGFTPESPLVIGNLEIVYIPMLHGSLTVAGWLISEYIGAQKVSIAYLTDCNAISDESISLINRAAQMSTGRLVHVVLDGLRARPHSTHFSFDEALECAAKIGGEHTWITHICHDMNHEEITAYFMERSVGKVLPAYDGLVLKASPLT